MSGNVLNHDFVNQKHEITLIADFFSQLAFTSIKKYPCEHHIIPKQE